MLLILAFLANKQIKVSTENTFSFLLRNCVFTWINEASLFGQGFNASILGADQVGFHLYEYARHFMTTCHRVLGYTSDMSESGMIVNVDGREVRINCTHVGVDIIRTDEILNHDLFEVHMKHWKDRFPNKIVIVGMFYYLFYRIVLLILFCLFAYIN